MSKYLFVVSLFLACACQQFDTHPVELESRKAVLKRIAESVKAKGDVQSAAKMESDIIALDEKDPKSFIALSKSLISMGEKDEAVEVLRTGTKINPENSELMLALAKGYVEADRAVPALDILMVYKGAKDVDYYGLLGLANDKAGNSIAAKEAYQEGLKINPKSNMLKNNLALSYIFDKDYKNAIPILEELVKLHDANSAKYRANLALAYGMSNQGKKAEEILKKDLKRAEIRENLKYYRELRKENVKK